MIVYTSQIAGRWRLTETDYNDFGSHRPTAILHNFLLILFEVLCISYGFSLCLNGENVYKTVPSCWYVHVREIRLLKGKTHLAFG